MLSFVIGIGSVEEGVHEHDQEFKMFFISTIMAPIYFIISVCPLRMYFYHMSSSVGFPYSVGGKERSTIHWNLFQKHLLQQDTVYLELEEANQITDEQFYLPKSGADTCYGWCLLKPGFAHGQFYVAISRVISRKGLKVLAHESGVPTVETRNIVYREVVGHL